MKVPSVVIVAAMKDEVEPLIGKLDDRQPRLRLEDVEGVDGIEGRIAGWDCLVVWCGVGKAAASRTSANLLEQFSTAPEHAFVVGLAGGLDPDLESGDVIEPARVVVLAGASLGGCDDSEVEPEQPVVRKRLQKPPKTIELNETTGPTLVTAPQMIAGAADKAALWTTLDRSPSAAVDMETFWVLEPLQRAGSRVHAVRSISDTAGEELPDFLSSTKVDGSIDRVAVVRSALVRPWWWPALMRLRARMKTGAAALAERVVQRLGELEGGPSGGLQ